MPEFLSNLCDNILITHSLDPCEMNHTHAHPQYELYLCTSTIRQRSVINGEEYVYSSPCAIISPPYTIHSMSSIDPDASTFDRFVIYFSKKIFDIFDPNLIPDQFKCKNKGLFFELTDEQASYLKDILTLTDPQGENESVLVLAMIFNKLASMCSAEIPLTIETSSLYIQDILMYISENFNKDICPISVSKKFAVSRSKLDRDFKKYTGNSVHEFINICRLNQAKMLLECHSEGNISDLALKCGFQSETYFFQFIKKHLGITPSEYKKIRKNKK